MPAFWQCTGRALVWLWGCLAIMSAAATLWLLWLPRNLITSGATLLIIVGCAGVIRAKAFAPLARALQYTRNEDKIAHIISAITESVRRNGMLACVSPTGVLLLVCAESAADCTKVTMFTADAATPIATGCTCALPRLLVDASDTLTSYPATLYERVPLLGSRHP